MVMWVKGTDGLTASADLGSGSSGEPPATGWEERAQGSRFRGLVINN